MLNIVDNLPAEVIVKEYDVEDVYVAIAKNGWEWLRGEWFTRAFDRETGDLAPVGACVLGQGALNLNVIGTGEENGSADNILNLFGYSDRLGPEIPRNEEALNRVEELMRTYTIEGQLARFTVPTDSKWYVGITSVSSTIIDWNDQMYDVDDNTGERVYKLETYEDVLEMVHDLLSPYFGEEVQLLSVNREIGLVNG